MSTFWLIVLLFILFLYAYYRLGYAPYQVFKRMNIPGPPPLPFFGNTLPLYFMKGGMDLTAEWAQKYGPVCGYFLGTLPVLSISDPAVIQRIFITNFRQFPDRSVMYLMNSQATGLPLGIFECKVDQWKKIRRIASPAFTNIKLKMLSCHLEKSCSVMLERMLEESVTSQSIDVVKIYKDCALEVTILSAIGQEVQLQRGEAQDFKLLVELGSKISHGKILPCIFNVPFDHLIGDQFPWFVKVYYWLGLGSYLPAFRKLKAVLTDCMKERKRKAKAKQLLENCVLNMLVASCGAEEEHHFSDDEILSHCITFLIAAYDTTSVTLACATHLLATHTHVQDKLCSLLDEYWSQHQDATVSTVAQEVTYLDMVIDETLRLYPPAPRLSRKCQADVDVCGIQIPKEMSITIPVHYIHRMESIWGDPDVFRPERFEREESASRPPCSFMPMGLGPRNCVGLKLAKVLMKVAFVSILKRHHFTRADRTVDVLQTQCHLMNMFLKYGVFVTIKPRK